MNHYEIKLEYDVPDWGEILTNQHYKTLVEASTPTGAIEEVKDWVRDDRGTSFIYYSDGHEDIHWRVSCANRIHVPANCLFLDDRVIRGQGWVSDMFIAVPEANATWLPEYIHNGQVDELDFEKKLFSDLEEGEEVTFSHYGKAKYRGEKCIVFQTADGQQIAMAPHYHDFVQNQLHASTWLRCPMKSRHDSYCIVANDATGHPVAYIMPYVGDSFEVYGE